MGELAKKVLEQRRQVPQPETEDTIQVEPCVTESDGESLPFQPGDRVSYRVPDPRSTSVSPEWQEHTGIVLQVDPVGEMALIEPSTEPGVNWRWVWWGYVQGKPDEK